MTDLDKLIHAIECTNLTSSVCKDCPYGYQKYDDSSDYSFWWHDDERVLSDALTYLKQMRDKK